MQSHSYFNTIDRGDDLCKSGRKNRRKGGRKGGREGGREGGLLLASWTHQKGRMTVGMEDSGLGRKKRAIKGTDPPGF